MNCKIVCPQHITQSDARYDNVISSAEAMEREKQEVSEVMGLM